MFKVRIDLSPKFIKDLFSLRELQTRSDASFCRPDVNTTSMGEQSLRCFGPIVLDVMLPEHFKRLTNSEDLKPKYKHGCHKTVHADDAKNTYLILVLQHSMNIIQYHIMINMCRWEGRE